MLHYTTVDAKTLALLKKLLSIPEFKHLRLVGGTALALQLGHRHSIDLNLFGSLEIDEHELNKALSGFNNINQLQHSKNINIFLIDNIKVDIVNYHYPWLESSIVEDDIRLAGIKDICAMKLAAVTGRGTRKDFIDIFFLLKSYSLEEMMEMYKQKYHDGSEFMVLRSLSYFDEAEKDAIPSMFANLNWSEVKDKIIHCIDKY